MHRPFYRWRLRLTFLFLCVGIFFSSIPPLHAQAPPTDILSFARSEIDTLCSATFAGRGYIDQGHYKAAQYIAHRFREMGLKPLSRPSKAVPPEQLYFQPFEFEVNICQDAQLQIDQQALFLGKDFIVNRFSGAGSGEFELVEMGYGVSPSKKGKGKIVVIQEGWPEKWNNNASKQKKYGELKRVDARIRAWAEQQPAAMLIMRKKLTAGFVPQNLPFPVLDVKTPAFPAKMKQASLQVEAGVRSIQSQNVLGVIPGTTTPDTVIVICGHYDHLGKQGEALFAGANDNASGISMLLSMADYFVQHPPKYSLLFIAFGGEEAGLRGSRYYVEQAPIIPLNHMKFLLNLDLMGNGIEGITAVGGKDFPAHFDQLVALNQLHNYVPVVRARKNAPNSDHFFFLQQGVTGFFIYTLGGPTHYHDIYDIPDHIELSRYVEVRQLLISFLEGL